MVEDNPDCPVREYREHLLTEQNVYVSVGGMCEFLNKVGLTLKKNLPSRKGGKGGNTRRSTTAS